MRRLVVLVVDKIIVSFEGVEVLKRLGAWHPKRVNCIVSTMSWVRVSFIYAPSYA